MYSIYTLRCIGYMCEQFQTMADDFIHKTCRFINIYTCVYIYHIYALWCIIFTWTAADKGR